MQSHIEASDPAAIEFREPFAALGRTSRIAELFAVQPREARRWRDGTRRIPRGVQLVLRLFAAGVITTDDIERAAFAQANGSVDPAGDVTAVDSLTVAEKLCQLADNGECKWPTGDIDDPAQFEF